MAPYDSDDSLDDDQDYTETDVLLGYASKESNGDSISRLGGQPVCSFCSRYGRLPKHVLLVFLTLSTNTLCSCSNGSPPNPPRTPSQNAKPALPHSSNCFSSTASSPIASQATSAEFTFSPAVTRPVAARKAACVLCERRASRLKPPIR